MIQQCSDCKLPAEMPIGIASVVVNGESVPILLCVGCVGRALQETDRIAAEFFRTGKTKIGRHTIRATE